MCKNQLFAEEQHKKRTEGGFLKMSEDFLRYIEEGKISSKIAEDSSPAPVSIMGTPAGPRPLQDPRARKIRLRSPAPY